MFKLVPEQVRDRELGAKDVRRKLGDPTGGVPLPSKESESDADNPLLFREKERAGANRSEKKISPRAFFSQSSDGVSSVAPLVHAVGGAPPGRKLCVRCGRSKTLEQFTPNPRLRSGLNSWCRECCREANRRWRAENRDAYNLARHMLPARLECSECGAEFFGRPNRKTCSPECRKRHKRELDTRWPKRTAR